MASSILTGIPTTAGRLALAKSFGNLAGTLGSYPICRAKYFRIGMGGFTVVGAAKVPKAPDPALTAIEATGVPGNIFFQRSFVASDVTLVGSTINLRCRLDPLDANDDGLGNPPIFFEIGVFDENDTLVVYSTFAQQTKQANKILTNSLQVYF